MATIVEASAAILAITISALFLVTQIASERYGSVTAHRFKNEISSQFLIRLQALCLAYASLAIFFEYHNFDAKLVGILFFISFVLFILCICTIPATLIGVLSSLRPRGLISWCTQLAINIINYTSKKSSYDGKNRKFLRWKMILLHECIQSLRLIGVVAVKDREDEIVHRVLEAFKLITDHYLKKIANTQGGNKENVNFRNLWDRKLAHNLFFRFSSETNVVSSSSEDRESFDLYWLENNILVSVGKILEASTMSSGGSTYRIRKFYNDFFFAFSSQLNKVESLPSPILHTIIVDFYIIFNSIDLTKNENIAIETQEFFSNRLNDLFDKLIIDEQINMDTVFFDNSIKTISGFQKSIANTIISNGSPRALQFWLSEIKDFYSIIRKKVSSFENSDVFITSINRSFLRCIIDVFENSISGKSHCNSKALLQFISFNLDDVELEGFFFQVNRLINTDAALNNRKPTKKVFILTKILVMILIYRQFIIEEKLITASLDISKVLKPLVDGDTIDLIKSHSLTHLYTEIDSFLDRRLEILIPQERLKKIKDHIWTSFGIALTP